MFSSSILAAWSTNQSKTVIARKFSGYARCEPAAFFESVEKELLAKAARPERFEQVVTLLELEHLLRRHPQSLSGGEKQRVAIGSALLSGKRLLFFDEPTSGLDLKQMEEVGNLLQEVAKEVDLLAVISHDKEFLDETCPYVIQLEQGKLVDTYQLATNGG
ncbi:ATP-binding cassette domain-containing protein [Enterococcus gallinarum]|nr:ATP-binding cassette domain-containing protein [Enterococcus gallinarum]